MTRQEWNKLYRGLRALLKDRPKVESACRAFMHNGVEWTARLCRCPNCKGINIMPSMIRQRPAAMRIADEWRWIASDRELAMRNNRGNGLDKKAYRAGIAYLRELRAAA